jgi:hypothetical protein
VVLAAREGICALEERRGRVVQSDGVLHQGDMCISPSKLFRST